MIEFPSTTMVNGCAGALLNHRTTPRQLLPPIWRTSVLRHIQCNARAGIHRRLPRTSAAGNALFQLLFTRTLRYSLQHACSCFDARACRCLRDRGIAIPGPPIETSTGVLIDQDVDIASANVNHCLPVAYQSSKVSLHLRRHDASSACRNSCRRWLLNIGKRPSNRNFHVALLALLPRHPSGVPHRRSDSSRSHLRHILSSQIRRCRNAWRRADATIRSRGT